MYFLVVSVLFDGAHVNVEGVAAFDSLAECQASGAVFVQQIIQPDWTVTATCELREVNSS